MGPVVSTDITPSPPPAGGRLIGLTALTVMALFGKITGVSGIVSGSRGVGRVVPVRDAPAGWPIGFIASLLSPAGPCNLRGHFRADQLVGPRLAGLLVEIGTGLGSGSPSGPWGCRPARPSHRSVAAVLKSMLAVIVTVFALHHFRASS